MTKHYCDVCEEEIPVNAFNLKTFNRVELWNPTPGDKYGDWKRVLCDKCRLHMINSLKERTK